MKAAMLDDIQEEFATWCAKYHNSPDIINLRFWSARDFVELTTAQELQIVQNMLSLRIPPLESRTVTTISDQIGEDDNMAATRKRNAKGRPAADTLLGEISPTTVQGKIVSFILDGHTNIEDALDNFMMERHSFMSQLNVIARKTGIGYSVIDNEIKLIMPPNVADPFPL